MEFSDDLTMNSRPLGIAAGPDGALWFTESAAPGRIGRITTEGDITEYSNGLLLITNPWFISAGPDGNMWFTGNNLPGLVARITLPPLVRDVAADEIGTALGAAARQGPAELAGHLLLLRVRTRAPTTAWRPTRPMPAARYDLDYVFAEVEDLQPGHEVPLPRGGRERRGDHHRSRSRLPHRRARAPRAGAAAGDERPEPVEAGAGARARVRQDGRGRRRRHRPLQGAGRRLAGARAERGASGGRGSRRAPREGQPEDRRLPRPRSGRSLRRRRVLGPPAPQGLRTRGRLPARRQLRELRPGFAPRRDRAPPRRLARARSGGSGDATAAAASEAMGATATRRCAAPAG